uniref:ATP synthase subunit d, mitochondrial n=1 Tax=Steinernema glaseri TaxID=37863 RepID=A0A1I7Y2R7_9BILA
MDSTQVRGRFRCFLQFVTLGTSGRRDLLLAPSRCDLCVKSAPSYLDLTQLRGRTNLVLILFSEIEMSDVDAYSLTEDILSHRLPPEVKADIAHTKRIADAYFKTRPEIYEPVKEYERIPPVDVDEVPGGPAKFAVFNSLGDYNFLKSSGSDFEFDSEEKKAAERARAEAKIPKLQMMKDLAKHTAELKVLRDISRQQHSAKPGYCPPRTVVPGSKSILADALEDLKKDMARINRERHAAPSEEWKRFGVGEYLPPHFKYLDFDRTFCEGSRSDMDSTASRVDSEG